MRVVLVFLVIASVFSVTAGEIVLVNGRVIKCKGPFEVKGSMVRYYNERDELFQIPLKIVNMESSRKDDSLPVEKAAPEEVADTEPEEGLATLIGDDALRPERSVEYSSTEKKEPDYRTRALKSIYSFDRERFARGISRACNMEDVSLLKELLAEKPHFPLDGELYEGRYQSLPIHIAVRNRNLEIFEILLDHGASPVASYDNGRPLLPTLLEAQTETSLKMAKLLIEYGAPLSEQTSTGEPSFHAVIRNGNAEILDAIIEKGANLELLDESNRTPLHLAIVLKRPKTAMKLVDAGAVLEPFGKTAGALITAVSIDDPRMIAQLIDKGANPNMPDHLGRTPLSNAIGREHCASVRVLLQKGADPRRAAKPDSAFDMFSHGISSVCLDTFLLSLNEAQSGDFLLHAVALGKHPLVKHILSKGVDIDARDEKKDTALILAAREGDLTMVELLLEAGADVYAKGSKGLSAHAEASGPRTDAIKSAIRARFDN